MILVVARRIRFGDLRIFLLPDTCNLVYIKYIIIGTIEEIPTKAFSVHLSLG